MRHATLFMVTILAIPQILVQYHGTPVGEPLTISSNFLRQKKGGVAQPKVAKPANVVRITKIDEKPVKPDVAPEVGHRVNMEGTIPDPKSIACFVVHPRNGNTWWVQNLPGPPDKIGSQWRISGLVYCGTETLGLGEEFDTVILTETERSFCHEGKQFKTADFPNHLLRSEIVKVKRTRN